MRVLVSVMLVLLAFVPMAAAELPEDVRDKLSAGLEALGPETGPEQLHELAQWLFDEGVLDSDWRVFFSEYFDERPFTAVLAQFFEAGLAETRGSEQARLGRVSGLAAAVALGEQIEDLGRRIEETRYAGAVTALAWLHEIVGSLPGPAAGAVLEDLRVALAGRAPALVPVSGSPPVQSPDLAWLGAQLGLVLRDYAEASSQAATLATVLNLQGGGLRFWQSYGVLLLDNSGLANAQVESLGRIYGAIPANLHNIGALIVPDTTGIGPNSPELRLQSGQIVAIPNIPLGRLTWEREFAPTTSQPVAAEFTVAVAQQIVRAIQAVQVAARPELAIRRAAILANAGRRPVAYLRQAVAPEVYLDNPDELLPSLAYLWFVNSRAMFATALYLFELGQRSALDQFLLMADLMSGGGTQTPLYATGPDGSVERAATAIRRVPLPPPGGPAQTLTPALPRETYVTGTPYVTGIVMGGFRWEFEIGPRGVVLLHHKWLME